MYSKNVILSNSVVKLNFQLFPFYAFKAYLIKINDDDLCSKARLYCTVVFKCRSEVFFFQYS
jgi:hypothetical protein